MSSMQRLILVTLLTFVSHLDNNAVAKNRVSGNSPSIETMGGFLEFWDTRE